MVRTQIQLTEEQSQQLSLVDCVSFAICQQAQIQAVFAFDDHFSEQGFEVLAVG